MKLDKANAIRIVTKAAQKYDEFLNSRHFLIVYRFQKEIHYTEVGFRDFNFLHLTGIKSSLSAQSFYERCLNHRLSENDIEIDSKGKAVQKLTVLPYLHDLLYHNCMIGDFVSSGIMIRADYFVGDTKLVLSVGFRKEKGRDCPVTLYSGDVRKLTNPTNKVLAILVRKYPEPVYRTASFVSKGIDLTELPLPEHLVSIKADGSPDNSDS